MPCRYCSRPTRPGRVYCSRVCGGRARAGRVPITTTTPNKLRRRGLQATARTLGIYGRAWRLELVRYLAGFDPRCDLCGRPIDLDLGIGTPGNRRGATIEHVTPWAQTHDDSLENLALAHWICNAAKCGRDDE